MMTSAAQASPLTQTKFVPPRLRDDIVPRCRLLDALYTAIRHHALMLVSAPAGYGKTTLPHDFSPRWLSDISLEIFECLILC